MFGCLTFEMYLLGRQLVFTDHKPLLPLFNNPRKFGPARVERIRNVNFKVARIRLHSYL